MAQSYKIHINHSLLFLIEGDAADTDILSRDAIENLKLFFCDQSLRLKPLIDQLMNAEQAFNYVLLYPDFAYLRNRVFACFKLIEAAGGLVKNGNKFLLIHRRGFWDLPKGKHKKGESIAETAVREVREECGLSQLTISGPIRLAPFGHQYTFHTYTLKKKYVLKRTWWFYMETKEQKLIPQQIEDIDQAVWVNEIEMDSYKSKVYASIRDVLSA